MTHPERDLPTVHSTPARPRPRGSRLAFGLAAAIAVTAAIAGEAQAPAAETKVLIVGTVHGADAGPLDFSIRAKNRREVVGGSITLGDSEFEITKTSMHGLVGARRFVTPSEGPAGRYAEFLVFSSSYTEQTAVGRPWVAAKQVSHCEEPYNAYVALYRVNGEETIRALGPTPYPTLVEDLAKSDDSHIFCFMGDKSEE